MTVVATIDIPPEQFVLDEVLGRNPGLRIEFEPVVPLCSTRFAHVRVSGGQVEAVVPALRADPAIESFSIVDRGEKHALVRIEWAADLDGLVEVIAGAGGTILEATGQAETWRVRLRFGTHDALSRFYRQRLERGLSLDLTCIENSGGSDGARPSQALTDTQRVTLSFALEKGYFEVPRKITLQDLAEELSVSDTAVSQRFRRSWWGNYLQPRLQRSLNRQTLAVWISTNHHSANMPIPRHALARGVQLRSAVKLFDHQ